MTMGTTSHVQKLEKVYSNDIYPALGLKFCHLGYWRPDNTNDFHKAQEDLIEELAAPLALTPADTVLDVGGGNADTAVWLHQKYGCKVVVVDIVGPLIEQAKRTIQQHQYEDSIEAICGDILTMEFPQGHFTHVLSIGALYHIDDKEALMARLYSWLKPGGKLAVSTYDCLLQIPFLRSLYLELSVAHHNTAPIQVYDETLQRAGFCAISRSDQTDHILGPSTKQLWSEPYYSRMLAWHRENEGWFVTKVFQTIFTWLHFSILKRDLLRIHFIRAEKPL